MFKIGHQIPNFSYQAVINNQIKQLSLYELENNKLLFFYPLNFTFVCPTELHALQENLHEFQRRNTHVLAVSVDSVHSHMAWLATPRSRGGIEGISYPLISDLNKTLSHDFGVLNQEAGIALRGVFLIDKNNVLQHVSINNLGLGRNVHELLRLIDALAHVEQNGEVCPANWVPGKRAMKASQDGLKEFFG